MLSIFITANSPRVVVVICSAMGSVSSALQTERALLTVTSIYAEAVFCKLVEAMYKTLSDDQGYRQSVQLWLAHPDTDPIKVKQR